jgi:hypothetical protein
MDGESQEGASMKNLSQLSLVTKPGFASGKRNVLRQVLCFRELGNAERAGTKFFQNSATGSGNRNDFRRRGEDEIFSKFRYR